VPHGAVDVLVEDRGGVRVVELRGPLDVFSASVVGTRVLAGMPSDTTVLVLELAGIECIDSAGASALVRLHEHARLRDLEVHARLGETPHISPTILSVLRRVYVVDDVVDLRVDDEPSAAPSVATSPVTPSPVPSTN
jgi:ABC-type transporter Mla MlaB component